MKHPLHVQTVLEYFGVKAGFNGFALSRFFNIISGVCLAKPTPIDLTDPTVIGEDIFKDLLPIETLEASSVYRCHVLKFRLYI